MVFEKTVILRGSIFLSKQSQLLNSLHNYNDRLIKIGQGKWRKPLDINGLSPIVLDPLAVIKGLTIGIHFSHLPQGSTPFLQIQENRCLT